MSLGTIEPPRITSLKNVILNPTFEYYGYDEYFVADKRGYVYLLRQLAKSFLKHDDENIIDSRLKLNKVMALSLAFPNLNLRLFLLIVMHIYLCYLFIVY